MLLEAFIQVQLPSPETVTSAIVPRSPALTELDARWREVVVPTAVTLMLGKRGSGKSALAYWLLELFRYRLSPYVVSAPAQAGKLLRNLPALWEQADPGDRRRILLTMLNAVYVDTVEEKSIVTIRPKPAFRPLFEIASIREGSDVVLINEPPQASIEPEAADLCFWWRRGRVELPVQ